MLVLLHWVICDHCHCHFLSFPFRLYFQKRPLRPLYYFLTRFLDSGWCLKQNLFRYLCLHFLKRPSGSLSFSKWLVAVVLLLSAAIAWAYSTTSLSRPFSTCLKIVINMSRVTYLLLTSFILVWRHVSNQLIPSVPSIKSWPANPAYFRKRYSGLCWDPLYSCMAASQHHCLHPGNTASGYCSNDSFTYLRLSFIEFLPLSGNFDTTQNFYLTEKPPGLITCNDFELKKDITISL